MVTKRPIELTLVYSPEAKTDYAIFHDASAQPGPLHDFNVISQTLSQLNQKIDGHVSDVPIRLSIYSRNVPDLSLIDLPGYIQVTSKDQPLELKGSIAEICKTYLKEPNIILAILPADSDMANSEALHASRIMDPKHSRTIDVITKADLVDPERLESLLNNKDYPLRHGFIAVSSKPLFEQHARKSSRFANLHPMIGIDALKSKIGTVLHEEMLQSISTVKKTILNEIESTRYVLKSRYNSRFISPSIYLNELLGQLKLHLRQLESDECAQWQSRLLHHSLLRYTIDLSHSQLLRMNETKYSDQDGKHLLDQLIRSGIGKKASRLSLDACFASLSMLMKDMDSPLSMHQGTISDILSHSKLLLAGKEYYLSNQIEDAIRPIKSLSRKEHGGSANRATGLDGMEMFFAIYHKCLASRLATIHATFGRERVFRTVKLLDKCPTESAIDGLYINQQLLSGAKEAVQISYRLFLLRQQFESARANSGNGTTPSWLLALNGMVMDIVKSISPLLQYELNYELLDSLCSIGFSHEGDHLGPPDGFSAGLRSSLQLNANKVIQENEDVRLQIELQAKLNRLQALYDDLLKTANSQ